MSILRTAISVFLALAAVPAPAAAQRNGSTTALPPPTVTAARLSNAIAVDGRLDEEAWQKAPVATGLRQYQPNEGAPESLSTEVRFLFDDRALYVGARMVQPSGVVAPLARRDQLLDASGDNGSFNSLTTDKLVVRLDPYHNRLDDAWFEVNPSGSRGEQFNGDPSWDPVWDVATHVDSEGWTAEMRIPFSQLRFSTDPVQTWGLQIWRYVDSLNEQAMWSFRPRGAANGPAFYGQLEGLAIPRQPRQVELLPYVVGGGRFDGAAEGSPYGDKREGRYGFGGDLKYLLTTNLTLDATVNPDFGQVEVDPSVLNLSAFETYYDEKRPFFVAGRSAFSFGGMRCMFCNNTSSLSAFYSRRIGRPPQLAGYVSDVSDAADTPENTSIIGAAKITGRTSSGYTVGILNAVTGAETARYLPDDGDREAKQVVEPLTNYFVGRVKKELRNGATTVGGIVTSMARRTDDPVVESRLHSHAETVGVDWYHTWHGREYSWMGSTLFSNVSGSPGAIERTQRSSARYFQRPDREGAGDGAFEEGYDPNLTSLRGFGFFTRVGKDSGGVLRWELMANSRSPGFENNDLAYLSKVDYVWVNGNVGASLNKPTKAYRSIFTSIGGATERNFDGDLTRVAVQAYYGMEFPNYWNLRTFWIHEEPALDDRLTRGGPVVKRTGYDFGHFQVSTDARSPVVFDVQIRGSRGIGADSKSFSFAPGVALKPASNIFVQLSPTFAYDEGEAQYVTSVADPTATAFYGRRYVFGAIRTRTVSISTRLNWTFTPTLTLQLFAQPFVATGDYSSFREFAAPRAIEKRIYGVDMGTIEYGAADDRYLVDPDGAGPAKSFSFGDPDFTSGALRGTAVLRWEYRPGSTLFFVWTQQRSSYDPASGLGYDRARLAIFDHRPVNVFQVKLTYWIGR